MPVVVTASVVFFGYKYLRKSKSPSNEAWKVGLAWLAITIVIDLVLFLPPSPMHLGIVAYIEDIGLTYLIIPLVTIGLGRSMGEQKEI